MHYYYVLELRVEADGAGQVVCQVPGRPRGARRPGRGLLVRSTGVAAGLRFSITVETTGTNVTKYVKSFWVQNRPLVTSYG